MNRAADWLKQAERDLGLAATAIDAKYYEWVAFGAQQSAEKAVKALIQSLHGSVRGHSITEMLRQLPPAVQVPKEALAGAQGLDRIYVTWRYPNGFASGSPSEYFNEEGSRELVEYARTILEFCRSQISGLQPDPL
jgi:HEPN domain-containing protein